MTHSAVRCRHTLFVPFFVIGLYAAALQPVFASAIETPVPRPEYKGPVASVSLRGPAKRLFGGKDRPAALKARAIGSYARGCLSGAIMFPPEGEAWQAMRLSRNRNWGHPELIAFLRKLATDAKARDGWNGLLVGDLAQPRGGPMLTGHSSHQVGLDADIWLRPMPDKRFTDEQKETVSAISMLEKDKYTVDPKKWTESRHALIRRAASDSRVARIFVHPGIKKALCEGEKGDRKWLRKIRPWYGHHYHFHVRLSCPKGSAGCKNQAPPPAGDGCGKELAWWFTDEPWAPPAPKDKPARKPKPKPQLTLASLPKDCRTVLLAEDAE